MVKKVAENGRGSCSLVQDNDENLKGLVIAALANASEPSLKNCKFTFGNENTQMGEVFRSKLISRSAILSVKEFSNLKVAFTSEQDPVKNAPINL
jgi:hypothetical protein